MVLTQSWSMRLLSFSGARVPENLVNVVPDGLVSMSRQTNVPVSVGFTGQNGYRQGARPLVSVEYIIMRQAFFSIQSGFCWKIEYRDSGLALLNWGGRKFTLHMGYIDPGLATGATLPLAATWMNTFLGRPMYD